MKKCCCISCLVVVILIIALICVALFVITPNMIGIGDAEIIDGYTLNELELGDENFYSIIVTLSKLLSEGNEEELLGGEVHTRNDLEDAANKLGLEVGDDGHVDYSALAEGGKLNKTEEDVTLSNKQFASLMNDMVKFGIEQSQQPSNPEEGGPVVDDFVVGISDDIRVAGFIPTSVDEDKVSVEITIGVDLKSIVEETGAQLPTELLDVLPDGMSFVSKEIFVKKGEEGYEVDLESTVSDLLVNGEEIPVINKILNNYLTETEDGGEASLNELLHNGINSGAAELLNTFGVTDITLDGFVLGGIN